MVVIGNALILFSLVPALAFCVLYHLRVDWRRSEMSRHVMAFMALITTLLLVGAARQIAGDATWFKALRLAVLACLPYVLVRRLWLLIKAQTEVRRERQEEGSDHA